MNLKKRLKNKGKSDEVLLDIPKVIFEDLELQVTVGQWLGILSSKQLLGNSWLTAYIPLSAKKLLFLMKS